MAAKPNIRSFRFSDEIACILESQPGPNMSAKFERLVESCYCDLERKQEQLAQIEAKITERRDTLRKLEKATEELSRLEQDLKNARFYFGIVERRAGAIAEKVESM